jgi:signal transduction histidine kinase/ActR/RegA family two-component response regulator
MWSIGRNGRSSARPVRGPAVLGDSKGTLVLNRFVKENDMDRELRTAQALAQLSEAMLTAENSAQLAASVLEIFAAVAQSTRAALRVREDERLRSVAAIGLEEEVASGFSVALADALPRGAAVSVPFKPILSAVRDGCRGDAVEKLDHTDAWFVALPVQGELLAVLVLCLRAGRTFSADDEAVLQAFGARAALALAHRKKCDGLAQALQSHQDVLGVVAHDLRNPLNVIGMAANILLARLPDSAARRPVERILRGVERANRLVQDLLVINAIEGGRFAVDKSLAETADTILASLESQQTLVAGASIIIATDLSPGLPPIEVDSERLLEVFENLVGNAIKFTPPGGTVTVGASHRDREILFWVKDSGAGIAEGDLPHLFDRFWQARKKDRRGTGLGLTICKAIVEAHGGRIWAESVLGKGSSFFFTIPTGAEGTRVASTEVANILLVDDRVENLISLKAILDRPEYRLVTATSGEEALKVALKESFSVALIDIAMPGMNGLEVATHLKNLERSREIPIIFVTAFGDDPQEIHRAYSAGGADYLVKPLDSEIVRKKVAVFVDLSARRQAQQKREVNRTPA